MLNNKEKYRTLCKKDTNIPIFIKDWWLDSVCGEDNWDIIIIEKGGQIFATMPIFTIKKKGFSYISHPKLTQTMGIYFNYPKNQKYYKKLSFEKEMIEKIIKELPKYDYFYQAFNFKYTNLLPFYWNGFTMNINYTYIIENIELEELEKRFETDIRRRRKKAKELGVIIYESEDINKFYELNNKTFKRQNRKIPYEFEFINNLYQNCKKNSAVKMFFAEYNKSVIAVNFLIFDKKVVYYLMGGIDPEKKDLGAMDLIQYESIKFAIETNRVFDFEGSMVESIEKYFRSFGAIQKPYFSVYKTNSKILKIKKSIKEILN